MRKLMTLGLASLLVAIPFATSAQEAFTSRSVNVRAGPDTSYPAVATLGGGAPVEVMGCLDDWSWCDVVFGYNRGWVYAPYLTYVYQGARVPFYSYAPSFGIPIVAFSLGSYWDRYYRGRPWYGRRDYWERRAPVHVRPSGPPPRSTPPSYREHTERQVYRPPSVPSHTGSRETQTGRDNRPSREASVPSRDHRGTQAAPSGALPTPPTSHPQEMRRASPTQQSAPAPAVRGPEKSHAPEGEKGRGKEHEGAKP